MLRAFIYKELGDSERQLIDLNKAINLHPGDIDLLKWRGSLYLDGGTFEKAIADLRQVKIVADDAELETYLGFAYFNLDKADSALRCIDRAIELDATYLPAYLYASSFSIEAENYVLALTYLNLALRLDPKNPPALLYKGLALIETKDIDAGCSCLAKAFAAGQDDAVDYLKQYCYDVED